MSSAASAAAASAAPSAAASFPRAEFGDPPVGPRSVRLTAPGDGSCLLWSVVEYLLFNNRQCPVQFAGALERICPHSGRTAVYGFALPPFDFTNRPSAEQLRLFIVDHAQHADRVSANPPSGDPDDPWARVQPHPLTPAFHSGSRFARESLYLQDIVHWLRRVIQHFRSRANGEFPEFYGNEALTATEYAASMQAMLATSFFLDGDNDGQVLVALFGLQLWLTTPRPGAPYYPRACLTPPHGELMPLEDAAGNLMERVAKRDWLTDRGDGWRQDALMSVVISHCSYSEPWNPNPRQFNHYNTIMQEEWTAAQERQAAHNRARQEAVLQQFNLTQSQLHAQSSPVAVPPALVERPPAPAAAAAAVSASASVSAVRSRARLPRRRVQVQPEGEMADEETLMAIAIAESQSSLQSTAGAPVPVASPAAAVDEHSDVYDLAHAPSAAPAASSSSSARAPAAAVAAAQPSSVQSEAQVALELEAAAQRATEESGLAPMEMSSGDTPPPVHALPSPDPVFAAPNVPLAHSGTGSDLPLDFSLAGTGPAFGLHNEPVALHAEAPDLSPRPRAPASSSAGAAESVASGSDHSDDEPEEYDEEEDNRLLAEGLSLSMHPGSAVNGALSALGGLEFWSCFDTELLRAWLHDYSLRRVPVSGRKPLVDQRTSRPRMLDLLVGRPDLYARPLAGVELSELQNNWRRFHPDATDDQVPGLLEQPNAADARAPSRKRRGRSAHARASMARAQAKQKRAPTAEARRLAAQEARAQKKAASEAIKAAAKAASVAAKAAAKAAANADKADVKAAVNALVKAVVQAARDAVTAAKRKARRKAATVRNIASRAALSDAARADLQATNTAAHREYRANQHSQSLIDLLRSQNLMLHDEFAEAFEDDDFPRPVSERDLVDRGIIDDAATAAHNLPRVCAVCDCFITALVGGGGKEPFQRWPFDRFAAPKIRDKLSLSNVNPPLPFWLTQQYDLSSLPLSQSHHLTDLLLSMHPAARDESAQELFVCEDCAGSLDGRSARPPRLSIANHNAIGRLPVDLLDMSVAEKAMTTLWHPRLCLAVLQNGGSRCSKGHVLSVEMNPEAVARKLPVDPDQLTFRVILAGASTPLDRVSTMHVHAVRKPQIVAALAFLKQYNPYFRDVERDQEVLDKLGDDSSLLDLQQHGDETMEAVGRFPTGPGAAADPDDEGAGIAMRHIGLISAADPTTSAAPSNLYEGNAAHLDRMLDQTSRAARARTDALVIRMGSKFRSDYVTGLELIFPHEFPYGRGGTSEIRRVPLGLETLLERLLKLSSGQFQTAEFVLKAYNILARREAASKAFVKVQLKDQSFAGLTRLQLKQAADYQRQCSAACHQGKEKPPVPAGLSDTATRFFSTLRATVGAMTLSDDYAKVVGRPRVLAMWRRFGPPTLMVTLTPDDLASPLLMHFAGKHTAGELPSSKERRFALAERPGAVALTFQQYLAAFVRYCLGYSDEHHTTIKGGGLFGEVLTYVAAVEEQGRGSLHAHVLVWVRGGSPLCSRVLSGRLTNAEQLEQLRREMCAYCESISTAQVQCPQQFHQCPRADEHRSDATPHFGQVSPLEPYRQVLQAGKRPGSRPMHAPIVSCNRCNRPHPHFSVHETNAASITAARDTLGLPEVDFSTKSAYHADVYQRPSFAFQTPLDPVADGPLSPYSALHRPGQYDAFLVEVATVQHCACTHDSAHRASCLKAGGHDCRYRFPMKVSLPDAVDRFANGPVIFNATDPDAEINSDSFPAVEVCEHRDALSAYQNAINLPLCSIYRCNHDVKLVSGPGAGFYMTMYTVKTKSADEAALAGEVIRSLHRGQQRSEQQYPETSFGAAPSAPLVDPNNSSLQVLLRAAHGATQSLQVGANSAAHIALGGERYPTCESFASLCLSVAERHATGRPVEGTLIVQQESKQDAERSKEKPNLSFVIRGRHTGVLSVHEPASASVDLPDSDELAPPEIDVASLPGSPIPSALPSVDPAPAVNLSDFADPPAIAIDDADATADLADSRGESISAHVVSPVLDYQERSLQLELMSWYEVVMKYTRRLKTGSANELSFLPAHPLHSSHVLAPRTREVVPVVHGGRIPDERKLDLDAYGEDSDTADAGEEDASPSSRGSTKAALRNLYGLRMLLLFAHWRKEDFDDPARRLTTDALGVWNERSSTIPDDSIVWKIIEHERAYRLARDHDGLDDEYGPGMTDDNAARKLAADEEDELCDILASGDAQDGDFCAPLQPVESAAARLFATSGALTQVPPVPVVAAPLAEACPKAELVRRRDHQFREPKPAARRHNRDDDEEEKHVGLPPDRAPQADWIPLPPEAEGTINFGDLPEDIAKHAKALREMDSLSKGVSEANVHQARELVAFVCRSPCRLNDLQRRAVLIVARNVFWRLFGLSIDAEGAREQPDHQVVMYLAGEAGTGKSAVIHAITQLFDLLGRRKSLGLCAMTGTAATVIGAKTLHSMLSLAIGKVDKTATPVISPALQDRLFSIQLLIVDEISMMPASVLFEMDRTLRAVYKKDLPYGGLSLVLVGDFSQLPPVKQMALVSPDSEGHSLWRTSVDHVIVLQQQMRQAEDPEYALHLGHLRANRATLNDLQYFNRRVSRTPADFTSAAAAASQSPDLDAFIPVVVYANRDRVAINDAIARHIVHNFIEANPTRPPETQFFVVRAMYAEQTGGWGHSTTASFQFIREGLLYRQLTSPDVEPACDVALLLYPGMKVMICENLCVERGIANGSQAIVQRLQLHPPSDPDKPPAVRVNANGCRELWANEVACVIVRLITTGARGCLELSNAPLSVDPRHRLGPGEFAVFIGEKTKVQSDALRALRRPPTCKFVRWQFPLIPAFCLTAHKTQGMTLPRLIFATSEASNNINYVVFSRCRSLSGIHLLAPLNPREHRKESKQQKEIAAEMTRLKTVEAKTMTRYDDFFRLFAQLLDDPQGTRAIEPQVMPQAEESELIDDRESPVQFDLPPDYVPYASSASKPSGYVPADHVHGLEDPWDDVPSAASAAPAAATSPPSRIRIKRVNGRWVYQAPAPSAPLVFDAGSSAHLGELTPDPPPVAASAEPASRSQDVADFTWVNPLIHDNPPWTGSAAQILEQQQRDDAYAAETARNDLFFAKKKAAEADKRRKRSASTSHKKLSKKARMGLIAQQPPVVGPDQPTLLSLGLPIVPGQMPFSAESRSDFRYADETSQRSQRRRAGGHVQFIDDEAADDEGDEDDENEMGDDEAIDRALMEDDDPDVAANDSEDLYSNPYADPESDMMPALDRF